MKPRDLELFSCFDTSALHLEPRGGRAAPPSIGRPRVPTGTATPGHSQLGAQLGHALEEAGQVGGGGAEVVGAWGTQRLRKCRGEGSSRVARTRDW